MSEAQCYYRSTPHLMLKGTVHVIIFVKSHHQIPNFVNTIMQLSLYYVRTCPFCVRVLLALKGLKTSVELKNLSGNRELRSELIKNGGKSQVPCLKITSGNKDEWLYESADIIRYLEQVDSNQLSLN